MRERLLGFTFLGVLVAYAVNLAADWVHARLFAESLWFQAHWYIPFVIVPVVALLALGFACGLFRPKGPRWADGVALWLLPCWSIAPWVQAIPAGITASRLVSPARASLMRYRFAT